MERFATSIVVVLAAATIGVGLIYMTTKDPSWTFKWQEIFKDVLRILVAVYVPLTVPKWKILRDVCFIFAGWYLCDLGFEVYHLNVNESKMPQVSDVGVFLTYALYFACGLIFAIFTKSKTWNNIIRKF